MANLQLMLKKSDELKLLGPRNKGRKTAGVSDRITQQLLNGYTVPDDLPEETHYTRSQIALSEPVLQRLESLSKDSGRSICFIVRNMLGLDY